MIKTQGREKIFAGFILEHVYDRWRYEIEEIDKRHSQKQEEIENGLLKAFESVCEKTSVLQEKFQKGPVKYIYISFLRTSLIEGKSLYRIDTYDESWFLDKCESYSLWDCGFVFESLFNHVEDLNKKKKDYFGAIRDTDIDRIKILESSKYHHIASCFIESMAGRLTAGEKYKEMQKDPGICVLVGEYMDSSKIIYKENGVVE